jgi:Fe-S-cluster containining protein
MPVTMAKTKLLQLNVITPPVPYPSPPCTHCTAACCRKGSFRHDYAVELGDHEQPRFAEARRYLEYGRYRWAVPYDSQGNCGYLAGNQCQVYDQRPEGCAAFNCLLYYASESQGRHGDFLVRRPEVVLLIEQHRPEFVTWVNQRNQVVETALGGKHGD